MPRAVSPRLLTGLLLSLALLSALALRLPCLDRRPMHVDEAVQAVQAAQLRQTGHYAYNPREYHGPTLYYLTLPVFWLTGATGLAQSAEATYRIVPVLFGVGLIALLALLAGGLGRAETIWAALFTALSPAMVYYSRFYIQEMLLIFFTLAAVGCAWRYALARRAAWAVAAGAALGLMHATKETCVIVWGCMGLAWIGQRLWARGADAKGAARPIPRRHLALGAAAAAAVSAVLFSSFFTHAAGPLDSLRALGIYFARAGGEGTAALHRQPWHYYLGLLALSGQGPGPGGSEGALLALAALGIGAVLTGRARGAGDARLLRFLALFALAMTLVYSAIPYKTPWTMLGFWHALILMAGVGAAGLWRAAHGRVTRGLLAAGLLAASLHLAAQAWRAAVVYPADTRNPYVYAQTVPDLARLAGRIQDMARLHPDGARMKVQVVAAPEDYWPLPWYLRRLERVGYWDAVPPGLDAPVIVVSSALQPALRPRLNGAYQPEYAGLRPDVLLIAYYRADLWEKFLAQRAHPRKEARP
jgi:uncharacterized protein (TIGR03663 family)